MPTYKTPNVYVEEVATLPPSVVPVSTAIPAFIGCTEKAGNDNEYRGQPIRISSILDYTTLFGVAQATDFTVTLDENEEITQITAGDSQNEEITQITADDSQTDTPEYLMYYALRLFFDNGGGSCYIVSIGDYSGVPNKQAFTDGLAAVRKEDEPTLILLTDAVHLSSEDYYSLCDKVLTQCNVLKDRFAIFDVLSSDDGTNGIGYNFRQGIGTSYLKYGAAYYPYLQTTLNYYYTDDSVTIVGLASDTSTPSNVGSESTGETPAEAVSSPDRTLAAIKTGKTELYNKIKAALDAMRVVLPPSSAVAGVYAKVDRERGVWKAPANVSLASVIGPTVKINNEEQEALNVDPTAGKSINAIRSFTGKGTLIWGSRTLAGNDNEWRYIPVRRLFNLIEESIQKATAFVVFESNSAITWLKVKTIIESYLDGLWRQGALAGATQQAAYFVKVGLGQTMTELDILEGRMIIEIGISAVRPAEFIILRFSHKLQES